MLVYRRTDEPLIPLRATDVGERRRQYEAVDAFFRRFHDDEGRFLGGYRTYRGVDEFARMFKGDLEGILRWFEGEANRERDAAAASSSNHYFERHAELNEGDAVVFVTDGVTEAGRLDDPYGYRFTSLLERQKHLTARAITEGVLGEWSAHPRPFGFVDDAAIVAAVVDQATGQMTEPPIVPIVLSRFSLAERTIGDVTILELAGAMTLGDGDEQLKAVVTRLIDAGSIKLVLDLTQLLYVDSAGLGELVRTYQFVKHRNGELFLFHMMKPLEDLLYIRLGRRTVDRRRESSPVETPEQSARPSPRYTSRSAAW